MVWLYPAALAGLVALAGPLIVHLLRRQRARTLVVPTVRFVPAVAQSVVRVRHPTDLWLLLLRLAIVACAALALAQPLLLTDARAAAWSDRLARVVVVDRTQSAAATDEAIAAALQPATFPHRIDATDVGTALRRAAAWLDGSPPARREIVVLSDFQRGTLDEHDVDEVPKDVGLRFVSQGTAPKRGVGEFAAAPVLSGVGSWQPRIQLEEAATRVTYAPAGAGGDGLRLLTAPQDAGAAATLVRIVTRAGAHAPMPSEPIIVRFPGGPPRPAAARSSAGWVMPAALRLLRAADAAELPVSVAAGTDALLVDVTVVPDTLAAAEALKAALDARVDPEAQAEHEVGVIPTKTLAAWSRDPAPADAAAWQQSETSDARWLWLAVLMLLGAETVVRRAGAGVAEEEHARAA